MEGGGCMAQEYEVRIPGASNIFKFGPGPKRTVAQKRAIIQRMRAKSPLPGFLQWIPSAINLLDDVQDIMITGLVLAKPLLRRIPLRFVPVLGWVLTINDLINLTNAVLATGILGSVPKKVAKNTVIFFSKFRYGQTARVDSFMGKTAWLSFALQAAQASQTITGVGLALGGIMGMITDTFWGIIRLLGGAKVTIKGPPPDDIFAKAARVITQSAPVRFIKDLFSGRECQEIICGHKIAVDILAENPNESVVVSRLSEMGGIQVPQVEPSDPGTIEALQAEGIPIGGEQKGLYPQASINDTFAQMVTKSAAGNVKHEQTLKDLFGETEDAVFNQCIFDEANIQTAETMMETGNLYKFRWTVLGLVMLTMYEQGWFPRMKTTNRDWLFYARGFGLRRLDLVKYPFSFWDAEARHFGMGGLVQLDGNESQLGDQDANPVRIFG